MIREKQKLQNLPFYKLRVVREIEPLRDAEQSRTVWIYDPSINSGLSANPTPAILIYGLSNDIPIT